MSDRNLDNLVNEALIIFVMIVVAREFLNELANEIAKDPDNRSLSPVAAKHVETMQRSNEQLVKIIGIKQKQTSQDVGLTDEDKASIFDMMQISMTKRDYFDFSDLMGNSVEVFGETLRHAFGYDSYGGKRKFVVAVFTPVQ